MVLNPCCCGISLQSGCKIIAFVQILSCTFTLVSGILGLTQAVKLPGKEYEETYSLDADAQKIVFSIVIVIGVIGLILALLLLQGARKKQARKLFVWFFVRFIIVVLLFAKFIYDCVHVRTGAVPDLIGSAVNVLFDAYCAFVVWCFWKEVKAGESDGTV